MVAFERAFPPVLTALHALPFGATAQGMDFAPFDKFLSRADTDDWLRTWTRNPEASLALAVFGEDKTGGRAAFFLTHVGVTVLQQPIVYLGGGASARLAGVVARNFSDYLWLLAGGVGPAEAMLDLPPRAVANRVFAAFAKKHAQGGKKSRREILATAKSRFPDFAKTIAAQCAARP